ncbi:MAG TPA: hypothetical protein VMW49_09245 [Candidatus Dormibacteraeota bacterium]|nr:hypothetical protein [Candidatus Dormibacteraeota bacterium]
MSYEAEVSVRGAARTIHLRLPWETVVAEVQRLAQEQLPDDGAPGSQLWCTDGTSMLNKGERALAELRDRRICPKLEFELRRD